MKPTAGLCDTCRHQQLVPNTRGSTFSLCLRSKNLFRNNDTPGYGRIAHFERGSKADARYPKYPPLPVLRCAGHEPEREP